MKEKSHQKNDNDKKKENRMGQIESDGHGR